MCSRRNTASTIQSKEEGLEDERLAAGPDDLCHVDYEDNMFIFVLLKDFDVCN